MVVVDGDAWFFRFPEAQWKTLRTRNTIDRLHENSDIV